MSAIPLLVVRMDDSTWLQAPSAYLCLGLFGLINLVSPGFFGFEVDRLETFEKFWSKVDGCVPHTHDANLRIASQPTGVPRP